MLDLRVYSVLSFFAVQLVQRTAHFFPSFSGKLGLHVRPVAAHITSEVILLGAKLSDEHEAGRSTFREWYISHGMATCDPASRHESVLRQND